MKRITIQRGEERRGNETKRDETRRDGTGGRNGTGGDGMGRDEVRRGDNNGSGDGDDDDKAMARVVGPACLPLLSSLPLPSSLPAATQSPRDVQPETWRLHTAASNRFTALRQTHYSSKNEAQERDRR